MTRTYFRLDLHDATDDPDTYRTATRIAYENALRALGAIPGRGHDHRNAHRDVGEAGIPVRQNTGAHTTERTDRR